MFLVNQIKKIAKKLYKKSPKIFFWKPFLLLYEIILARQVKYYLMHPCHLGALLIYFLKWKEIVFLPTTIDIEPNNNCNFRCPHCQVTHWNKKIILLNEKSFNRILDQLPSLVEVKLQGLGEPLLNKQFINMLKLGERRGISMRFFSNASLCNQEVAEQLMQLRDTWITFSIDGVTAETFEKIRVRGDFEEVKKNIKNLIQLRGDKKQPRISIWSLVTKDNIEEIIQIVKLTKDLGIDSITLQPFINNWGKKAMEEYADIVRVDINSKYLVTKLEEAEEVARKNQINMDSYYGNFFSKSRKCSWPWNSAFITSNGDVVPCCVLGDSDTENMGNVFEKKFVKIWYSKKYRDFREKIRTFDLPNYCKHCYIETD
jgi:pyrroloquinoline quinone biosynthesis protein E